jgi:hypothetical protein
MTQIAKGGKPDKPDTPDKANEDNTSNDDDVSKAASIIKMGQVRRGEAVAEFKQPMGEAAHVATPEGILAAGRKRRDEK